jgi:hypothetical protein
MLFSWYVANFDSYNKTYGSCHSVAVELSRRGVPFLIYSGHQEDQQLLSGFHHLTWIEKPVPSEVLVQECQQLLVGCD